MRGLEVGWGIGAAICAWFDVIRDGRVAGVVEALAADAAGWGGGEDLVAGFAVSAVAATRGLGWSAQRLPGLGRPQMTQARDVTSRRWDRGGTC